MDKQMEALDIAIVTLNVIKNMAKIIPMADAKEDVLLILNTMNDELENSLKEINNLE